MEEDEARIKGEESMQGEDIKFTEYWAKKAGLHLRTSWSGLRVARTPPKGRLPLAAITTPTFTPPTSPPTPESALNFLSSSKPITVRQSKYCHLFSPALPAEKPTTASTLSCFNTFHSLAAQAASIAQYS
jgi:hypothetical protein